MRCEMCLFVCVCVCVWWIENVIPRPDIKIQPRCLRDATHSIFFDFKFFQISSQGAAFVLGETSNTVYNVCGFFTPYTEMLRVF